MRNQSITGQSTEQKVRNALRFLGMEAEKPKRDIGVDLEVWHSAKHDRCVNVQIGERWKTQKNRKYRWFPLGADKKRNDSCDFFILVSERYEEYWVFPKEVVFEIIQINAIKYRNRLQAEINLDIADDAGVKLTERYAEYLNNFQIIKNILLKK